MKTRSRDVLLRAASCELRAPSRAASCELRAKEEGFTLAALLVILTIISIVIAYTVPTQWSLVMKRERDRQTIFLMKQFARGISEWEMKHKSLPVSLEQLQKARKPRMLRGDGTWPCPLTGSEKDWILVPPTAVANAGMVAPGGNPAGGGGVLGGNDPNRPTSAGTKPGTGAKRLNKDASPKDYVGPFVGVRPNATGQSFIALNDAEDYSEWVYTVYDLRNEIAARQMALTLK